MGCDALKFEEITEDQLIGLAMIGTALHLYGVAKGAEDIANTLIEGTEDIVNEAGQKVGSIPIPKGPIAQAISLGRRIF